jgi:hypothetical protein
MEKKYNYKNQHKLKLKIPDFQYCCLFCKHSSIVTMFTKKIECTYKKRSYRTWEIVDKTGICDKFKKETVFKELT